MVKFLIIWLLICPVCRDLSNIVASYGYSEYRMNKNAFTKDDRELVECKKCGNAFFAVPEKITQYRAIRTPKDSDDTSYIYSFDVEEEEVIIYNMWDVE